MKSLTSFRPFLDFASSLCIVAFVRTRCTSVILFLLICGVGCRPELVPSEAPEPAWDISLSAAVDLSARCQISFADPLPPLATNLVLDAGDTFLASEFPVIVQTNYSPRFRLQGIDIEMAHPIIDLELGLTATQTVRLLVVELKDRTFHAANQAEVRRSEARKWATHLRSLNTNQTLLVMGDFYDDPDGAVLRTLYDLGFTAVPAVDDRGHSWTHHDAEHDAYHRYRFLLMPTAQTNRVETSLDPETRALRVRVRP